MRFMYIAAEAIWHIEEGQGYRWRGKIAGQEEKSVKGIRMEGWNWRWKSSFICLYLLRLHVLPWCSLSAIRRMRLIVLRSWITYAAMVYSLMGPIPR